MVDISLPGDLGSSVTQLYAGGVVAETAISTKKKIRDPSAQVAENNRFWASPPRSIDSVYDDGLIINLAKKKKINYLSLDLPAFPHHIYFHYYDDKTSSWKELHGPSTGVIRIYIDGSTPSVVGAAAAYQAKQHPSHYGAGHWLHYDIDLIPVTTSRLRITGNRDFGSRKGGPKDPQGRAAKYSLGIRNLDFGWRVRTKQDVPLTNRDPDILTERQSFTQVVDMFGSPVELKVRENRASDLLRGSQWKSEPMPVSYAVVNFYVDSRDAAGNPQVIDRFDVVPLHSGAHLNLYYATETPAGAFTASDSPIVFPSINPAGEADPVVQGSGISFPDKISYLDVTNQAVQLDPSKPFWMGIEFRPQWTSADLTPHIIFDCGDLQFAWDATGVFKLTYQSGALFQQAFSFDLNARVQAFISFDGERLSFFMPDAQAVMNLPTSMAGTIIDTFRFGAELGDTSAPVIYSGNYRLNAFLVKQEFLSFEAGPEGMIVPDPVQRFMDDPSTYLQKPEYHLDDDHSTDNALLRYLPSFALGSTSTNPFGFIGGPGDIFGNVVWTPVIRDYKLRSGALQFPPTRAKFFKFEFTNLTPEPYSTFMPLTRKVKTYSSAATVTPSNPQLTSDTKISNTSVGLSVNADVAQAVSRFLDSRDLTNPTLPDVFPTEALHATSPGVQSKLDSIGGLYGFQSWQPGTSAPRYTTTSKHVYEEVEVGHSKKIAYFVGLSKLDMYRVDYTSDEDAEQYLDLFDDLSNIDPTYLTERVVIGTTNFVLNPSFENGTTGYTLYTNGTATGGAIATVADGKFSTNALKVSANPLGTASTDRVGWQQTYTSPTMTGSIAYSIFAKHITGSATLRLNVEYYDGGAAFLSSATQSFTAAPALGSALIANGGFETNATGWVAASGATIAQSTDFAHSGTHSLKITPPGAVATVGATTDSAAMLPVTAGKVYSATAWLYSVAGWTSSSIAIDWYSTSDATTSFISTSFGQAVSIGAAAWTFRSETFTAPAGAIYARVRIRQGNTPATTDILYADDITFNEVLDPWVRCSAVLLPPPTTASVKAFWWLESGDGNFVEYHFDGYQVENLRLTDYCDGTQTGCVWNGTANASTSTRAAVDIHPLGWDGDILRTGTGLAVPATTMSKRFSSTRRVRGVQFATAQSSAVQLLPDPNFLDPALADWVADGDIVSLGISDEINSTLGSTVKIVRSSATNTWGELRTNYLTWQGVQDSQDGPYLPTYGRLEGESFSVGYGGIRLRQAVQVSEAGRVYAAARVYADHALGNPLILQILSSSGDVLAEKEQIVTAGKVVEWTVGYTIGEMPTVTSTWADIMQRDPSATLPTYAGLGTGTWADLSSVELAQSRQLLARIIQQGAGQDTFYVDALALFEDPIVWEFSNDDGTTWWPALDIRNDPNGVLIFPNSLNPVPTDPTGLRWRVTAYRPNLHISALAIRPWYAETVFGIPRRESGVMGGPNIQPTDHYPPIVDDPMFRQWKGPIPQDWYFLYRRLLLLENEQVPVTPVSLPTTFASPNVVLVDATPLPPVEPYLDLYTENYPSIYGVPNTGYGTYVDNYDPSSTY